MYCWRALLNFWWGSTEVCNRNLWMARKWDCLRLFTMPQEVPRDQQTSPCKRNFGSLRNSTTPSKRRKGTERIGSLRPDNNISAESNRSGNIKLYFSQEETDSGDIIAANNKEKNIARQVKQYEDFLHKNNKAQHTLVVVQSERDALVKKLDEQTSIAKQMRAQRRCTEKTCSYREWKEWSALALGLNVAIVPGMKVLSMHSVHVGIRFVLLQRQVYIWDAVSYVPGQNHGSSAAA